MAPPFKISFPLPSWRNDSSATGSASNSEISTPAEETQTSSPQLYPPSKAERILGGPESGGLNTKTRRREKKSLRKYPSFMNVTLAGVEQGTPGNDEDDLSSEMYTPPEHPPQRPFAQTLKRQGSSPLLGILNGSDASRAEYFGANAAALQARRTESSATLRAQYSDAPILRSTTAPPVPIAAQDGPQKNGYIRTVVDDLKSAEETMIHIRNLSEGSDTSKASSSSKIANVPRRRPSVTDPPTLYPETPRPFHAVSPPPALINASLPKSMQSADPLAKPLRTSKWWQRSKGETKAERVLGLDPEMSTGNAETNTAGMSSVKVNVKRPKPGSNHWFDALEDEESFPMAEDAPESDSELESKYQLPTFRHPPTISEVLNRPLATRPRGSSVGNATTRPGVRKLSFSTPQPGNPPVTRDFASHLSPIPGSPEDGTPRSSEAFQPMSSIDLQMESVLNLSSSEDEDGTGTESIQQRRRRLRTSVERADFGDEILVGNAHRVHHLRSRPVLHAGKSTPNRASRSVVNKEDVPPIPQFPARPMMGQRNSSLRWRDLLDTRSRTSTDAGTESTVDNDSASGLATDTPMTSPFPASSSASMKTRRSSHRTSKLMQVTSDEERLLEAMREKRASIRASNYQEGFNQAIAMHGQTQLEDFRPQTAGADGRVSMQQEASRPGSKASRSSFYSRDSTTSASPPPPPPMLTSAVYSDPSRVLPRLINGNRHSYIALGGRGNRKSRSMDDLVFKQRQEMAEDAGFSRMLDSGFPAPPASAESTLASPTRQPSNEVVVVGSPDRPGFTAASRQQSDPSHERPPSLVSFGSPIENIPSTPSTGNLPLTPPPPPYSRLPLPPASSHSSTSGLDAIIDPKLLPQEKPPVDPVLTASDTKPAPLETKKNTVDVKIPTVAAPPIPPRSKPSRPSPPLSSSSSVKSASSSSTRRSFKAVPPPPSHNGAGGPQADMGATPPPIPRRKNPQHRGTQVYDLDALTVKKVQEEAERERKNEEEDIIGWALDTY